MADHSTPDRWERDTLIKLGERFEGLRHEVTRHAEADEEVQRRIDNNLQAIRELLEKKYVTKDQFTPTRLIAYGLVALIVGAVVTAWLSIVVVGRIHTP